MDLALETKLSEKAALKAYDERALTKEEQDQLNQIKVQVWHEMVSSLWLYARCFTSLHRSKHALRAKGTSAAILRYTI